jgi:hypothetical protein
MYAVVQKSMPIHDLSNVVTVLQEFPFIQKTSVDPPIIECSPSMGLKLPCISYPLVQVTVSGHIRRRLHDFSTCRFTMSNSEHMRYTQSLRTSIVV